MSHYERVNREFTTKINISLKNVREDKIVELQPLIFAYLGNTKTKIKSLQKIIPIE